MTKNPSTTTGIGRLTLRTTGTAADTKRELRENMRRLVIASVYTIICAIAPSAAEAQPVMTWSPASSSNYTVQSSRSIDTVVIHKVEGSLDSCVNWFKNPSSRVSAHYVVDSTRIVQMVRDKDRAWHAANYNSRSIGIENAGWSNRNDTTDAHYRRLASLVAYLCKKHGIPMTRTRILGHSQIADKSDPGKYFDWTLFMSYVQQAAGGATIAPPTPTTPTTTSPPSGISGIGVATIADVSVRASPGGTIVGNAPAQSGWVRTGNTNQGYTEIFFRGRRAWIQASHLSGFSGTGVRVVADTLNVRAGPSLGSTVVGSAYRNQTYVKSQESADGAWCFMRYDEEKRWVFKSYAPAFTLK